jgi:membrane protease YdiL (CAAX protease family)
MKKQLTYIAPLRAGIVLGILYGLLGLIMVPFFVLGALFSIKNGPAGAVPFGLLGILFPAFYAVAGFIGGVIAAAIYNLIAKWTGGLEFEVRDVPPTI